MREALKALIFLLGENVQGKRLYCQAVSSKLALVQDNSACSWNILVGRGGETVNRRKLRYVSRRASPLVFFWLRVIASLAALLLFLEWADGKIRPSAQMMISYRIQNAMLQTISDTVLEELSEEDLSGLVTVTRDAMGRVTSLDTDAARLSVFQANVTRRLSQEFSQFSKEGISVPLGTLTGNRFLSGLGPGITFHIIPSGTVDVRLRNSFESAGVNQSLYRVLLTVEAKASASAAGYNIPIHVELEYCLSETVVVGEVPSNMLLNQKEG